MLTFANSRGKLAFSRIGGKLRLDVRRRVQLAFPRIGRELRFNARISVELAFPWIRVELGLLDFSRADDGGKLGEG